MRVPYLIMLNEKYKTLNCTYRVLCIISVFMLSVSGGRTGDLFSYLYCSIFFPLTPFFAMTMYTLIFRKKYLKFLCKSPGFSLLKVMLCGWSLICPPFHKGFHRKRVMD